MKLVLLQLSPAPDHAGHHLDTVLVLEQPNVQFENAENVGKIKSEFGRENGRYQIAEFTGGIQPCGVE